MKERSLLMTAGGAATAAAAAASNSICLIITSRNHGGVPCKQQIMQNEIMFFQIVIVFSSMQ